MSAARRNGTNEPVLVVAPVGRDASVIVQMLGREGVHARACPDAMDLHTCVDESIGAIVITEEALGPGSLPPLREALQKQPPWSDLPVLVLTGHGEAHHRNHEALEALEAIANVTLIERPVRVRTFVSAVQAALRARARQFEARELIARERAARIALEAADRAKDEFLANVSHELRTPLNAILGWSRMLRTGALPEEKYARALETIERNATAQTRLVEDLLDVSRVISGTMRLQIEPMDLQSVIEQAIEVVQPAADARGITLGTTFDRVPEGFTGDAGRLRQVVWNLLTNAVKFTPHGGRVHVALQNSDAGVEIIVTDTGRGIPPEYLAIIFDRFRQVDGGPARAHGGLGLGLAIVRHLVDLHGGTIEAHSAGEGLGAAFTVRLPRTQRAARAESRPAEGGDTVQRAEHTSDLHPELHGLNVLVVDDEADARELLVSVLEHHQLRVVTASSAAEAVRRIREAPPAVLISDVGMPQEDGYSLIRRIRALPDAEGGRTPAVALTAYAHETDRARALEAGFDAHVAKPLEPLALIDAITRLAGRTLRA